MRSNNTTTLSAKISNAKILDEEKIQYTVSLQGGSSNVDLSIPLLYAGSSQSVLDKNGSPLKATIPAGEVLAQIYIPTSGHGSAPQLNLGAPAPSVTTDLADYAPGSTALITASNFKPGSTIEFQVVHVSGPGADGVLGTLDDTVLNTNGAGHESWYVKDGGAGDLDGAKNGSVQTNWFVNPDDSAGATFLLTAKGVEAGKDKQFGTADDIATGQVASNTFTDSAGAYSLKFAAADPALNRGSFAPTYTKLTPQEYLDAGFTFPVGRANPSATNPIENAVAYAPNFTSNNFDAVTSLAPKDMSLGQIVPYYIEIKVDGNTAPENGIISFKLDWLAKTTSGGDFGFDTNYKVIAAFVDTGEVGTVDPSGTAQVDSFSSVILGAGTSNERIEGTFQVSGLNSGDNIIVEIWVVLDSTIPPGVTGNVQASIESAQTGPSNATGSKISVGNQTVPLLRVQEFFSSDADLSVIKSDSTDAGSNSLNLTANPDVDPSNLNPGDIFTYTILAKNNSASVVANTVIVTDTLDPNVTFISASNSGLFADNGAAADTITWNLGSLIPGETQILTVTVQVNANAPTGSSTQDLLNSVSITSITNDPNLSNNTNTEPTNLLENAPPVIDIVKTGPAEINEGGEDVTWHFKITNNSGPGDPVTITSLNDDKLGDLLAAAIAANGGNPIVLQPGASFEFDYNPDGNLVLDGGEEHINTVTVTGHDDEGVEDSDSDDHTITGKDLAPIINIEKTGPAEINEGGEDVTWHFIITNNSATTDPITVTSLNDDKLGNLLAAAEAANGGNPITLDPGESFEFDYNPDGDLILNSGDEHTNIVTVVGEDDEGSEDSDTDDHTITAKDVAPIIDIIKTGPAEIDEGGEDVTWHFKITNNSVITDPLTITSLMDDKLGDLLAAAEAANGGNPIVLDPGESFEFDYNPDGDLILEAGEEHTNVVTVIGEDDEGSEATDSDDHTITANDIAPKVLIEKSGPAEINEGGEDVTYTFKITNISDVDPLTITSLNDDKLGNLLAAAEAANGGPIVLAVGASFEFDYNPDGDLLLNGGEEHTNTVTVVGEDNDGSEATDDDDHTITAKDVAPIIDIIKTGPAEIDEGGEDVTWHFKITNNSVITDPLTITSLMDDKLGDILAAAEAANGGNPIVLDPGESFEFDYNPDGDLILEAGEEHTNVVTVIGEDDEGSEATDSDDHTITANDIAPKVLIEKSGPAEINEGGEDVTYTFKITNISDVDPLTITSLNDDKLGNLLAAAEAANGGPIVLAVGASFEFDYNPDGDLVLDGGEEHTNTVTVVGEDNDGSEATDDDDHTITAKDVAPIIDIIKTGPAEIDEGGEDVTWHFKITNNSVITDPLTVTSLMDDKLGDLLAAAEAANGGNPIVLDPGESFEFDYNPDGDLILEAGEEHTNVVTVIGEDDEGSEATDSDDHTITANDIAPKVLIEKSGPAEINEGGEDVTYTFKITNISDIDPLTITALDDDKLGDLFAAAIAANGGNPIVLVVGASFEFDYNPDGDLVLNGGEEHTNTVTVVGEDNDGSEATDDDDHTITAKDVAPIIDIVKTGPAEIDEGGEDVTWHFKITNNSVITDPLTVTSLMDDKLGDLLAAAEAANGGNPIVLDPGESFEFDYNPDGDLILEAGEEHTNVVTVIGEDDEGSEATDSDDHTITAEDVAPKILIEKSGPAEINEGGEDVTYTFKITNISDIDPLTVTALDDDKLGNLLAAAIAANGGNPIVLAVGASFEFDYNPDGELLLNGGEEHTNTVTVVGEDNDGSEATDDDDHTITAKDVAPIIDIVKTGPAEIDEGGEDVTWHFKITNNSAITDPITITSLMDDKLGDLLAAAEAANGGNPITLDPGASFEFDYNPDGELVLDGDEEHTNTVTVTGEDDEGTEDSDDDDHTITGKNVDPSIHIEKTVDGNKDGTFHDFENLMTPDGKAMYMYEVTNTSSASTDNELILTSLVDDRGTASAADDVNLLDGFIFGSAYGNFYTSGDADGDFKVDFGETWRFKADLLVPLDANSSNTNTATVIGKDDENTSATDSDTASVKKIGSALIAPTGTTPLQYINGTAQSFEDYYAAQGGVIQYSVKTSGKVSSLNTINQTNPGVFFYYTGISGAIVAVDGPDLNTAPDPLTIRIDQSDNSALFPAFSTVKNNVMVYKVNDLNNNGIIDAGDSVTKVQLSSNQITLGTGANAGDVTVTFTPDAVGSLYIMSVKYDTTSVVGTNVGSNPAAWPTVHYDFKTDVGADGSIEETDPKGITIAPKFGALTLDGEAAQASAETLDQAALDQVAHQALQYWMDQYMSSEDMQILMNADIRIMDLGGTMLAGTDEQHIIWIDDDAAGHGWSTDENTVSPDKVDLLSALAHEFGHMLGLSHEEMDSNLALGERQMPLDHAEDNEIEFVDASELKQTTLNYADSFNHVLDFKQLGNASSEENNNQPQFSASAPTNSNDHERENQDAQQSSAAQNDQGAGKSNENNTENNNNANNGNDHANKGAIPTEHAQEVVMIVAPEALPAIQQNHEA